MWVILRLGCTCSGIPPSSSMFSFFFFLCVYLVVLFDVPVFTLGLFVIFERSYNGIVHLMLRTCTVCMTYVMYRVSARICTSYILRWRRTCRLWLEFFFFGRSFFMSWISNIERSYCT